MSDEREVTIGDVAEAAGAGPVARLLFDIAEHNAAERVAMLPTWEQLDAARKQGYDSGYRNGYEDARTELYERVFGPPCPAVDGQWITTRDGTPAFIYANPGAK